MTTFRLATLAAATALSLALPAHALEVLNGSAAPMSAAVGSNTVLTLSFDLPSAIDVGSFTLAIDWPSAGLSLDPATSTALGQAWPTFTKLFDPTPGFTTITLDPGKFTATSLLIAPLSLSAGTYTLGMSFQVLGAGNHEVKYSLSLGDLDGNDHAIDGSGFVNVSSVPEPSPAMLLAAGLAAVGLLVRRRSR
jgi:hypothetical protein